MWPILLTDGLDTLNTLFYIYTLFPSAFLPFGSLAALA